MGNFLSLVGIAILLGILINFYATKPKCTLIKNAPEIDQRLLDPIASGYNDALVLFAGYLEFVSDDETKEYLELKLEEVHYMSKEGGSERVRLTTNCATIDIFVKSEKGANMVQQIYVRSVNSDYSIRQCRVDVPVGDIKFNCSSYYTCRTGLSYSCEDFYGASQHGGRSPKLLTLHLSAFDLELDGDPTSISSGYFDLQPQRCKA